MAVIDVIITDSINDDALSHGHSTFEFLKLNVDILSQIYQPPGLSVTTWNLSHLLHPGTGAISVALFTGDPSVPGGPHQC